MRRFCRDCGAPWQTEWTECLPCADQRARRSAAVEPNAGAAGIGSIKHACALYFVLLSVCAVGVVAGLADRFTVGVEFFLSSAMSAIVLAWCAFTWRDVAPVLRRVPRPGWILGGMAIGVVTFALAALVVMGASYLLQEPEIRISELFLDAGYGWGMVLLCMSVQPAIIEELAFRGVVMNALLRVLSPTETILVSALMFMILHLSAGMFPHTLAMGIAAGYLRMRTGSLYPCMLLHFVHNSLCVATEYAGWW